MSESIFWELFSVECVMCCVLTQDPTNGVQHNTAGSSGDSCKSSNVAEDAHEISDVGLTIEHPQGKRQSLAKRALESCNIPRPYAIHAILIHTW